jgi:hypothetical protein
MPTLQPTGHTWLIILGGRACEKYILVRLKNHIVIGTTDKDALEEQSR